MMGTKERSFAPLVQVSLEQLVPQNHFYRHMAHQETFGTYVLKKHDEVQLEKHELGQSRDDRHLHRFSGQTHATSDRSRERSTWR